MADLKAFVAKHGLAIANTTHIVFNADGSIHANNAGIGAQLSSFVTNTAFQSVIANTNAWITAVDDQRALDIANTNAYIASVDSTRASDLANTNTRIDLVNTNLTSTNTALRTLIDDRLQVANADIRFLRKDGTSDQSVGGQVTFNNNVIISGNLTVSGTRTEVNTTQVNVANTYILLNSDLGSGDAATEHAGLIINRGAEANVYFRWNETTEGFEWGEADGVFRSITDADATVIQARNESGSTIAAGVPVYVTGYSAGGSRPLVAPADASDSAKMPALGITVESSTTGSNVLVASYGVLLNANTGVFSEGQELYVDVSVGKLTGTRPTGDTTKIQKIGQVLRAHASAGTILIQGAGRSNDIPNLSNGHVFIGNISGVGVSRNLVVNDISDSGTLLTNAVFQSALANTNLAIGDRIQVSNAYALVGSVEAQLNNYIANTEPRLNTLESTFTTNAVFQSALANTNAYIASVDSTRASDLANTNAYIAYVAANAGEVSNAYLSSTYTTNTAFQSALANTNLRFNAYLQVANVVPANTADIVNEKFTVRNVSTYHEFIVTVGTKTSIHPTQGGSTSAYFIDGEESPAITMIPGHTYRFNMSDSTNSGHPLAFYRDSAKTSSWVDGVSSPSTLPGNSGAYTEIVASANTPMVIYYQCQNHSYMGGSVHVLSDTSPKYVEQANLSAYWPSANIIAYVASSGTVTNAQFQGFVSNTNIRLNSLESATPITLSSFTVTTAAASGGGSLSYDDQNGTFTFAPANTSGLSAGGANTAVNNFISFTGNTTLRLVRADGVAIDADMSGFSGSGGGSVSGSSTDLTGSYVVYTANGTATLFTAPYSREDEEDIFVTVDGVSQRPVTDYTLFGANVTFSEPPPANTAVMIRTFNGLLGANTAKFFITTSTADGVQTSWYSPSAEATVNDLIVTVDGVIQTPTTDYVLAAQTVMFTSAPASSSVVSVRALKTRVATITESVTYQFANSATISQDNIEASIKAAIYAGNGSTTNFQANTNLLSLNNSIVTVDGVVKEPVNEYTVSGNTVIFNTAPSNGTKVVVREFNTVSVIKTNKKEWTAVSSGTYTEADNQYFVDVSGGGVTMYLPASASMGDQIKIIDAIGGAQSNNITVNAQGGKIMGSTSDLVIDQNRAAFTLVYYNSNQGWLLSEV